jgi:hypothetical protein
MSQKHTSVRYTGVSLSSSGRNMRFSVPAMGSESKIFALLAGVVFSSDKPFFLEVNLSLAEILASCIWAMINATRKRRCWW